MRSWSIEIWLLNEQGEELLPTLFEKATYRLHPSFEKRAVQGKFFSVHCSPRISSFRPAFGRDFSFSDF